MQYYIYKITNKLNGKLYIGQHKVPKQPEAFMRYLGKGLAIRAAIKKYGKANFAKEIIEYIEDDELHHTVSEREIYWIAFYNSRCPNGYNISPGGEGGCTHESAMKGQITRKLRGHDQMSEETKRKISIANTGKPKSALHRKHLSEHHRCRRLHKIQFEHDMHVEETYDSLDTIAKQYGLNKIKLRRSSEYGNFRNGIRVLDLLDIEAVVHRAMIDNGIFKDPDTGDLMTYTKLRVRKAVLGKTNDLYKTLDLYSCLFDIK